MSAAPKPRFLLFTGRVTSEADGDRHTIPAARLVYLYRLDPRDCVLYNAALHKLTDDHIKQMIWLEPRRSGDYDSYLTFVVAQWMRKNCNQLQNTETFHANR
jgi:hypothetical protein